MKIAEGDVFATIATSDKEKAKDFYGMKLGLKQIDENPAGTMYEAGSGKLFVYQSDTAGSGKATVAAWLVDDIDLAVQELKEKDVVFDSYDMPGATKKGDIYEMGDMKSAWFKDPDGNILSLASR